MKTIALALPLLITMSGSSGPETYTLIVDGVDDQLECKLNGEAVARYKFGQSGVTTLKPRPGPNTLVCTPTDTSGARAPHACWAFKYRIFKNWDEIMRIFSKCCARGCPDQPAPVRTDFEAK